GLGQANPRALHAGHQRLEGGSDDVRIDTDAEQRALADAHFQIGDRLGPGPGADRMLVVIEHPDRLATSARQSVDEGIDRSVALSVDPAGRTGAEYLGADRDATACGRVGIDLVADRLIIETILVPEDC